MAEKRSTGREHRSATRSRGWFSGLQIVQGLAVIMIILNILLLYGIFLSSKGIRGYQQQSMHVEELYAKVQKLKRENNRLFRKIQGLKNNPQALEKLVREQLGWVKANEVVVDFIPSTSGADVQGK